MSALNTNKLSNEGVTKYAQEMNRNIEDKQNFFIRSIENLHFTWSIEILDIWSASGYLTFNIASYFGAKIQKIIGIDVSEKMVQIASNNFPNIHFEVGNAYDLSLPPNSFDVIICSSVLHELWSYFWQKNLEAYNAWIIQGLHNMHKVLKTGGYILIKDPVYPSNDSYITTIFHAKSETFSWNNIVHSNLLNRSKHFIEKFPFFQQERLTITDNGFIAPCSYINEIIRHTSNAICDTVEHFNDELNEWYWSWNGYQWDSFIKKHPSLFKIITHETRWNEHNHSTSFYQFFDLYDTNHKKIKHIPHTLPTHQFTILQKI